VVRIAEFRYLRGNRLDKNMTHVQNLSSRISSYSNFYSMIFYVEQMNWSGVNYAYEIKMSI